MQNTPTGLTKDSHTRQTQFWELYFLTFFQVWFSLYDFFKFYVISRGLGFLWNQLPVRNLIPDFFDVYRLLRIEKLICFLLIWSSDLFSRPKTRKICDFFVLGWQIQKFRKSRKYIVIFWYYNIIYIYIYIYYVYVYIWEYSSIYAWGTWLRGLGEPPGGNWGNPPGHSAVTAL